MQKKKGKKRVNASKTFPECFYEDFLVALKGQLIRKVHHVGIQEWLREVRNNPAKLNEVQSNSGRTVLQSAVLKDSVEAIKALLDAGADPDIKSGDGQTALHFAGDKPDAEVYKVLLSKGANPNKEDNQGNTVLHKVVKTRSQNIIQILINHPGINLNVKNHQNKTPLTLAEETYSVPDAVIPKLLREKGATK